MARTERDAVVPALRVNLPRDPTGASFAAYVQHSAATVAVSLPEGGEPADFHLASTAWQLPDAVLARIASTAQLHRRGTDEIATDPAPAILIQVLEAGSLNVSIGARSVDAGPGDVVIYDLAKPFESRVEAFIVLSAIISRRRVPLAFLAPAAHGLRFPAGSAAARMIAGALGALLDGLDTARVGEAEVGLTGLCTVTAGLIEAHLAAGPVLVGKMGWADPLRAAAQAYIAEQCCDRGLKPIDVARHLGISRSGLYRLFEAYGGVEAVIYARRLDVLVRRLLLGVGPLPALRVLATESGFASAGRLRRAFEARFGTSPAQFRRLVEGRDQTWLAEQARRAGFASQDAWIAALAPDE